MPAEMVSVRISIANPRAVYRRALESYLADGGERTAARERLGTFRNPKLVQCAIEIAAEADHGGLFDFVD